MVRGIEAFENAFADFAGNYVIIGGTACERHESWAGIIPRATKDIDVILIVEALSHEFVKRFWEFIKDGGYSDKQVGEKTDGQRHKYYRFMSPVNKTFPEQIELFSRVLDSFEQPVGMRVTPIPTDADLSSLSAILMDDDYYHYTIRHSVILGGVHVANIESLIALKCKAYLEMKVAKETGGNADSKHIKKHRNDVFRMVASLSSGGMRFSVPTSLFKDIATFCELVMNDMPDMNLIRDMGLRRGSPEQLLNILKTLFEEEQ